MNIVLQQFNFKNIVFAGQMWNLEEDLCGLN